MLNISKWTNTGSQRSYAFGIRSSGELRYLWSTLGSDTIPVNSVSTTGFTDGTPHWIRVTHDVNNGAGGNDVMFYTSEDGATWTQLGSTITSVGTTNIFSGSALLTLSGDTLGTNTPFAGKIVKAQVYNGIGGTLVANFDASLATIGATTVTDSLGLVWTKQGNATFSLQGSGYISNLGASAVPAGSVFIGGIAFNPNGRIYVTTDAPSGASFIGKMAVRSDGALHVSTSAVSGSDVYDGRIAVSSTGQVRVAIT